MSDLFEYYNGVKIPFSKEIVDFTDSIVIHFITVKKLEASYDKYKKHVEKINENILKTDNREHVIIIFINSIPTVNYDGYIFVRNIDGIFINKDIKKSFALSNGKTIYPTVNGISKFIEMSTCWNISFKINDNDINLLSYGCINKSREDISKELASEIESLSNKLKLSKELIISKLIANSKNLDYYEYENTIESKFFKDDPNLNEMIESYDEICINNDEISYIETLIPSLIYTIKSKNDSIKIYLSGMYNKNMLYRFDNVFPSNASALSSNTLKDDDTIRAYIMLSNMDISSTSIANEFINTIKKNKQILLYTKLDIIKDMKSKNLKDYAKYIRTIYDNMINHVKDIKSCIQDDNEHLSINGINYFNLTNTSLNIKSILFSDELQDTCNINLKYSIKPLQSIAALAQVLDVV